MLKGVGMAQGSFKGVNILKCVLISSVPLIHGEISDFERVLPSQEWGLACVVHK